MDGSMGWLFPCRGGVQQPLLWMDPGAGCSPCRGGVQQLLLKTSALQRKLRKPWLKTSQDSNRGNS